MLSNQINLILFFLSMVLAAFYAVYYEPNVITFLIPAIGGLCLAGIALNRLGIVSVSRIVTGLFAPFATMALSLYSKSLYYDSQIDLDYFTFRFIILGCSILPAILFTTRERVLLVTCLLANLLLLLLHDPLHTWAGVGYIGDGVPFTYYYFTNVVIAITYAVLLGSVLFLKINLERSDRKNAALLLAEQDSNAQLKLKNDEIEAQHQELLVQSEKLQQNQQQLLDAYAIIENQKELLSHHNQTLETELLQKNASLSAANSELIKYNNELRQFSYTISHNLRGPVASLLGLLNLLDTRHLSEENGKIVNHVFSSAERLDAIIRDLNKIIDIRNDIFRIRQKISLEDELRQIRQVLHKDIEPNFIELNFRFISGRAIYSVRPMVHSILYNLISNAIKYRAPERKAEITVSIDQNERYYIFTVEDNGLGIDLAVHAENLFKLYKRFHYHTEGKGLGLYLVKLQCEALGGFIEVESELNRFTRFVVHLQKPENFERQILSEESHATIFYDASINSTGVIWRGPVTSAQYRDVFQKSLEFIKSFNNQNYVADLSQQGPISEDDQQWMFRTIMPEAIQFGLKRVASIRTDAHDPAVRDYMAGINQVMSKLGAMYEIFETMDEALAWMRKCNEQDLINTK